VYERLSKKKTDPRRASHEDSVIERLRQEPAFAAAYLKAAIDETDEPRVLLIALRRIAQARGGISKVARRAGIERESLHRALSGRGNPRFSTLSAVAKAVGLRLTVEPA
jgi:probable addiction module antidote protein